MSPLEYRNTNSPVLRRHKSVPGGNVFPLDLDLQVADCYLPSTSTAMLVIKFAELIDHDHFASRADWRYRFVVRKIQTNPLIVRVPAAGIEPQAQMPATRCQDVPAVKRETDGCRQKRGPRGGLNRCGVSPAGTRVGPTAVVRSQQALTVHFDIEQSPAGAYVGVHHYHMKNARWKTGRAAWRKKSVCSTFCACIWCERSTSGPPD